MKSKTEEVKLVAYELNELSMEDAFFEDTAFIGIVSNEAAYRLCWLINEQLDYEFSCKPEHTSELLEKGATIVKGIPQVKGNAGNKAKKKGVQVADDITYYLPVFECKIDDSSCKHLIYKLKATALTKAPGLFDATENNEPSLLPEISEMDFLWSVQSSTADDDAARIASLLPSIEGILKAEVVPRIRLENLKNLLL